MECLLEWSTVHGIDPNNKSITQYRKTYNEIIAKGVSFPSQKVYFKDPNAQNKQPVNNSQINNPSKPAQKTQLTQNVSLQKQNTSNNDTKKNQSIDTNGTKKTQGALEKTIQETLNVAEEYKDFLSQNLVTDSRPDEDSIFLILLSIFI